ncbi:hypothetical protein SARC_00183 [Sphaeroforma arctica JP610]|uniref:Uncharacterized protein n=1 Tax=Sphaeroforma arctica JP610 TaxID=667725 RepID=A0A0L0GFW8_9EUKA|nr:hypothetical protein SARC_00183 [Sphaeroforma arctica JP610]KNC87749.1 hypothetical protein SARC_00183 [Sphaeroforma arctica JP610]|eukprot:XP_014161651.1 hypothetical protein SARC_00183 [Sphaeroforma arctica JP610]
MLKAIERAKTYFKQEQSAVDAKDAAEMADMQLQKVITAYEKARTEQHLCEKQLEKELVGNMAKGASGKQSKGVSVVIDLQVQDALNNAAMCVQECKMELQRVDVEVKLAYKKAKKEIELCESIRITDRGSIDKAQIYYDTRDKILSQIDAAQRELDRKVHEDTRARLKVAQCLQALQNMSHKRREDLNSPTPTSAVEELVTSGLSRMSFSSQRCSQPHNHSLPTHHIHSTIDKHSPVVVGHTTPYTHVDSRTGDRQGNITTLGQTSTNSPHQQAAYNRSLREVGAEESEEDIDITDSPSLLGRVTAGATSPSFSTKSYSHYSRLQ